MIFQREMIVIWCYCKNFYRILVYEKQLNMGFDFLIYKFINCIKEIIRNENEQFKGWLNLYFIYILEFVFEFKK